MISAAGMPGQVAAAINDMLGNCAKVQAGQHGVILSHVDGLHGRPNLVDVQVPPADTRPRSPKSSA